MKTNSIEMSNIDYTQKKEMYEKVHKALRYGLKSENFIVLTMFDAI